MELCGLLGLLKDENSIFPLAYECHFLLLWATWLIGLLKDFNIPSSFSKGMIFHSINITRVSSEGA